MKIRVTSVVCSCVLVLVLVPLACGTTTEPDGSGGADSSGGQGPGGADGSGGQSPGSMGGGGADGLGGAAGSHGECERVHSMEDYCHATAEQAERCFDDDSGGAFDACMQGEPTFERLDACVYEAFFDCTSSCDWRLCRQLGVVEAMPELFNQEVAALCFEEPERTDVDCSADNWSEGRQQVCVDRAQECDVYAAFDTCVGANVVRPDLLVETDACLAGPCEELGECLNAVSGTVVYVSP